MQADTKYRSLTDPTDKELSRDIQGFRSRILPTPPKRQVDFVPAEVLLCLAASRVVQWRLYNKRNIHDAPELVHQLARLFKRPPGSVTAKMSNLLGGLPNQAKSESDAAEWLLAEPTRLLDLYTRIISASRSNGVAEGELPDFLPRDAKRWCQW